MTEPNASEATDEVESLARVDVAVVSGSPDPTDLAAITAVLTEVLDELAAEQGRREQATVSAWARSQKTVRAPLYPQAGAWRGFSG